MGTGQYLPVTRVVMSVVDGVERGCRVEGGVVLVTVVVWVTWVGMQLGMRVGTMDWVA